MNFTLHDAAIYNTVTTMRVFRPGLLKGWRIASLIIGSIALLVYLLATFLPSSLITSTLPFLSEVSLALALAYILLPSGITIGFFELFLSISANNSIIRDANNVAEYLDSAAARVFGRAERIARADGEKTITPDVLLLALTKEKEARSIFIRLDINHEELAKSLALNPNPVRGVLQLDAVLPPSDTLLEIIANTFTMMRQHGTERISLMDLFVALTDVSKPFQSLLIDRDLDAEDLDLLALWYESDARHREKKRRFWALENLIRTSPIGAGWSYGYTPLLNHFAQNITRQFKENRNEIQLIGREAVIEQIEEILARAGENNVLLVGEQGVGKKTIILAFSQMIARGTSLPSLKHKQLFHLNVPLLTSSSESPAEVRQTIISTLEEAAKAGNVILLMEDLHHIVTGESGISGSELMEIFIPYIGSNAIQVIATTDPQNFHREIATRGEVIDIFEKIEVNEPTLQETMRIVHQIIPALEAYSNVLLTYAAIKATVEGADKYIQTVPFPEKAINLLTEVISATQARGKRTVRADDVNTVITRKTNIPTGALGADEKKKLINLEEIMHRDIIGQDKAVTAVAQTLRRLRAGLTKEHRPAGVFLFIGPTGVGKTLTAKILAKNYFGSDERMIRFDMSEYQNPDSVARFLGSIELNQPGQLITAMRDNPFSVVLLDEFEKANSSILNLFLQIFDEGRITDVFGRQVNFEQSIIIATSNAAAANIVEMINQNIDPSEQKEEFIDLLIREQHFTPELLNRFDETVIFHPLSQEDTRQIAGLLLNDLIKRLKDRGYLLEIPPDVIDYVARIGFNPQFGARPMSRAIQETVEAVVAKRILEETIVKGTPFSLSIEDINHDET